jgi:hypothetical protein
MTPLTCILVGNGTSVLDSELGAEIDTFGTVIRFNRFEVQGFEKHVGSKTDVWFTGLGMRAGDWRLAIPYRLIYVHSWSREARDCPTLKNIRGHLPDARMERVDHAVFPEMAQFAGVDYLHWSTGAIAVWMMAQQFPHIHLHGFDWWDRPEQHYFNPRANRGTLHKPEIERVLIERLQAEGCVHFL